MGIPASAIRKMVEMGLQPKDILELCEVLEEGFAQPVAEISSAALRQRRYRENLKAKKASGITRDVTGDATRDVSDDVTVTPLARVRDITPTTEISGSVVVVVGERTEFSDDWPEREAAKVLVQTIASPRLDPSKSQGLMTTAGRLAAWKRDGASWQFDVLPVIQAAVRKTGPPIGTWKYFDAAIAQSIADNRRALEIPEAHERPNQNPRNDRAARRGVWAEVLAEERGETPGKFARAG